MAFESKARSCRSICRWLAIALVTSLSATSVRAEGPGAESRPNADAQANEDKSKPSNEVKPDSAEAPKPPDIKTRDVVRANLETSYVAYPIGLHGLPSLIFECNLAPHFFVNRPSWPVAFVLTPKVVLRMFNEESSPVRSPSFMPRIAVFLWFQQRVENKPTFYGSVTLSHHSNGQAGPFFNSDGTVNHEDGSFSTNFFDFALFATGFRGRFFGWSSVSLQWHPGFNEDPQLKGRYGLVRLNLATTIAADLPFHGQLNLRVSAILDKFQKVSKSAGLREVERFPVSLAYSMTVPGIDLGVYLGYYLGHDYYNIWFDRVIHTIQIGIAGGFSPTLLQSEASD